MQAVEVGTLKAQKHLYSDRLGAEAWMICFGRLGEGRSCGQFGKVNSFEAWDLWELPIPNCWASGMHQEIQAPKMCKEGNSTRNSIA